MRAMISSRFAKVLAGLALAGVCFTGMPKAMAETYTAGKIEVSQPWARPSTVNTGAAYFTLTNKGDSSDALTSVQGDIAKEVQLHTMTMHGNIMRMRRVEKLILPAGKSISVEPGGLHVMLIGLKQHLVEGQTFPLHLTFAKAGGVDITVHVQAKPPVPAGATSPQGGGSDMGGSMHDMPGMSGDTTHP